MAIKLEAVNKIYQAGETKTKALKEVSITFNEGEFIVVLGPSGSGKSTLLNVMGGLDQVSSGMITIGEEHIHDMTQKELTLFRRHHLGFIFQQYNLLQTLTVKENVEIGAKLVKEPFDTTEILEKVGLKNHINKYPYQLSGGEQQRVSIARALVKKPKILFCDEPTGALDETTGKSILRTLQDLNKDLKTTIILITHNPSIGLLADTIVKMNSGEIVEVIQQDTKKDALDIHWS
ncbi:MAG: ABC transporter ATP-binding protein [Candidatus Izemoplasmataceae bacterium]